MDTIEYDNQEEMKKLIGMKNMNMLTKRSWGKIYILKRLDGKMKLLKNNQGKLRILKK